MAYQADLSDIRTNYVGKVIGTGQCVAFVAQAANTPTTATWKAGGKVAANLAIPAGTAIATFDPNGVYGNHTDGRSHAAIYISQNTDGLLAYDQWLGQPVHQRTIHFRNGQGNAVNDGDRFCVIE